ncbi:MAG: DUF547 domain-containing protein [Acetobacteraceae bacterium]|nr:DUF547 domain-containing protein [Acetobacteraceae bacterium]
MQRRILPALVALSLVAPRVGRAQRLEALFAPRARLWERWTAQDARSTLAVDHAAWDGFLRRYRRAGADGVARLAYGAVTPADRQALEGYLGVLVGTPVDRLSRPEQYAYWVNLYNALTVRTVLSAYPVASIRDVNLSGGLLVRGPWDVRLATVAGEGITLNDIEHRILRPIWRDPRTHYVLNCASIGCPDIPAAALTAANAEAALDAGARAYVNHPRGVGVLADGSGLRLSSIYNWFAEDFGGEAGVVPHLLRHAAPPLAEAIGRNPRIAGYAYDWALNDAR